MPEKSIKDIIYENRKKMQLTQEQLADMLNVSNKTISKWENGVSYPDVLLIPKLANALNISINELFNTDDMNPDVIKSKNNNLVLKFKHNMLISLLLLILSPIPFLAVYFFNIYILSVMGIILGVSMILESIIVAIISTVKIYDYMKSIYHHERMTKIVIIYFAVYSLILYIPFLLLPLILKNSVAIIVLSTIIYLIFGLLSLFIMKLFKIKIKQFKNLILILISSLLFIGGFILMIVVAPLLYILFYLLSQIVNYMIIFLSFN